MKEITRKWLYTSIISGCLLPKIVFGLDSGVQALAANIGAIDFFEVTCTKSSDSATGDTDRLSFKLIENTGTPPAPQMLNATLTKAKLSTKINRIAASTSDALNLNGKNGAYTLTIDTVGTNVNIKTLQNYTIQYQCINANGLPTAGSSTLTKQAIASLTKTLANGKTAKYVINCASNKAAGSTDTLKVTLSNTTLAQTTTSSPSSEVAPTGTLSAQIVSGIKAKNTIGGNVELQNGNGIYNIMVNSPTNEAKSYHFEYGCLNKAGLPTQTSPVKIQQNQ